MLSRFHSQLSITEASAPTNTLQHWRVLKSSRFMFGLVFWPDHLLQKAVLLEMVTALSVGDLFCTDVCSSCIGSGAGCVIDALVPH